MSQFFITGIEYTQATQFRQAYDLAARMPIPDNSIPLVAGKRTVLRVYVSGATSGNVVSATAFPVSPSVPGFGVMQLGHGFTMGSSLSRRSDLSTTVQIDFTVPVAGTWDFDILATQYIKGQPSAPPIVSAPFRIRLEFTTRRLIRIRLVRIRYTSASRNLQVAAPTTADFWNIAAAARRMLPVPDPGYEIVRDTEERYDGAFTRIDPSAHDTTWAGFSDNQGTTGNLLNIMDRLAATEALPADVFYVGLFPYGIRQTTIGGWAVSKWMLLELNGDFLAHETGHKLGLRHAPCGGTADTDPQYPAYGGYPMGSIGEFGVDTLNLQLKDPATTYDIMSYCDPKWISPYNYQKAYASLPPLPPSGHSGSAFTTGTTYLPIDLYRIRERWVSSELPQLPMHNLPFPHEPFGTAAPKKEQPVICQRNQSGKLLRETAMETGPSSTMISPETKDRIFGTIPLAESVRLIELVWKGKILWSKKILQKPFDLTVKWPKKARDQQSWQLRWHANKKPDTLLLRIVTKTGRVPGYTSIHLASHEESIELDASLFPADASFHLELIAFREGQYGYSKSGAYEAVPGHQSVLIIQPAPESRLTQGKRLVLDAISSDPKATISWYSSIDGLICTTGTGISNTLSIGTHILEARSDTPFEQAARTTLYVAAGK